MKVTDIFKKIMKSYINVPVIRHRTNNIEDYKMHVYEGNIICTYNPNIHNGHTDYITLENFIDVVGIDRTLSLLLNDLINQKNKLNAIINMIKESRE